MKKDDTDEKDREEEKEEEEEKSLEVGDLEKSLDELEAIAKTGSRKDALLNKALTEKLEKSERDELFALMGDAAAPAEDKIEKSFGKGAHETFDQVFDVSPYLKANHEALMGVLTGLTKSLDQSGERTMEFFLPLAKSVVQIGRAVTAQNGLVKSFGDRMDALENQPARGPKAKANVKAIEKSSQAAEGDTPKSEFSKSEITAELEDMAASGIRKSQRGERIDTAVSNFEQHNKITKSLYEEVAARRRERLAAIN